MAVESLNLSPEALAALDQLQSELGQLKSVSSLRRTTNPAVELEQLFGVSSLDTKIDSHPSLIIRDSSAALARSQSASHGSFKILLTRSTLPHSHCRTAPELSTQGNAV